MQPICQSTSTRDFTYAEWLFRGRAADQWTREFLLNDYADCVRFYLVTKSFPTYYNNIFFSDQCEAGAQKCAVWCLR